jgi:hypothetical protein
MQQIHRQQYNSIGQPLNTPLNTTYRNTHTNEVPLTNNSQSSMMDISLNNINNMPAPNPIFNMNSSITQLTDIINNNLNQMPQNLNNQGNQNSLLFFIDTLLQTPTTTTTTNLNNDVNETITQFLNTPVIVRPSEDEITNATERITYNEVINNNGETACPIDLIEFTEDDDILRIRHCGHIFRENNIRLWFNTNVRCPLCRYDIREQSEPET